MSSYLSQKSVDRSEVVAYNKTTFKQRDYDAAKVIMDSSYYFKISNFSDFCYSKISHFDMFKRFGYDFKLFKNKEVNRRISAT